MKKHRGKRGGETGIALFMVISAVALLTVLTAELTYSTQVGSRMAYNAVDNLRAYYLAKSAYRLSLLRLVAYSSIRNFVDDPKNKEIKSAINQFVDQVWQMPLVFPPPIPKDASVVIADPIKAFVKESSLPGHYSGFIFGESSKINLNNLFITQSSDQGQPSGASTAPGATGPANPTGPSGASGSQTSDVDFQPMITNTVSELLRQRALTDLDFAETYRNVTGQDVTDAILSYIKRDTRGSNLPGFKPIENPKEGPLYSLTELHLVPGIDDVLYGMLADTFTVYTTPGINVNSITKDTLLALMPELTPEDAATVLQHRDDHDVGKPWTDAADFWATVKAVPSGDKSLSTIQDRFTKSGLKVATTEKSFRIIAEGTAGLSTRRVEAYVTLGPPPTTSPAPPAGQPSQPQAQTPGTQNPASKTNSTPVQLVYWRSI